MAKGDGVNKDRYPNPKKGQRLKCLGCGGRGIVPNMAKPGTWKRCTGCNGKGYIVA